MRGLVIDNFAGCGGASTGIEMAIGRSVDVAINHDPATITPMQGDSFLFLILPVRLKAE